VCVLKGHFGLVGYVAGACDLHGAPDPLWFVYLDDNDSAARALEFHQPPHVRSNLQSYPTAPRTTPG